MLAPKLADAIQDCDDGIDDIDDQLYENYKEARDLAQSVQQSIVTLIQPENTRVVKQGTDSTYLLKNAAVPTIIVECGFLSNKAELEKLKNDDYQPQMALAIVGGIMDYSK